MPIVARPFKENANTGASYFKDASISTPRSEISLESLVRQPLKK
jgi:hypothetical protein